MNTCNLVVLARMVSVLVLAAAFGEVMGANAEDNASVSPSVRRKLDQIVRTSLASGGIDAQRENALKGLDELKKMAVGRGGGLIPQIVLYESTVKDEAAVYAAEFILLELVKTLNSQEILTSVTPYLSTENMAARHRLQELMDKVCSGPTVDFQPVFSLMLAQKGNISDNLVRYMYERSPGDAMLGYLRFSATGIKWGPEQNEIFLAEHEISNTLWKHRNGLLELQKVEPAAMAQIEMLSKSKNWWVRLYAAETMRQDPAFRKAEIVERFRKDESRLVREAVAFDNNDSKDKVR